MEGDEGEIMRFLTCPSYFATAYTFSGEIVLVYVHGKKNPIAPYALLPYFGLYRI